MNSWTEAPPIVTKDHSGNGVAFFISERSRMRQDAFKFN